jgi:hypothetical protein
MIINKFDCVDQNLTCCNQKKKEGNLQTSDTLDQTQMLLTQTTPMPHAFLMHQTHRTQLPLLLQNG